MSFYTALTGLNGSQADIQQPLTTSQTLRLQVIREVEFGDIFAIHHYRTHPHQLVLVLF